MQVYFNYCFSPFSSTALVLITSNRVSVCTQVAKPETLDHLDIFVYCYFLNSCFCNSWKYNQIRGSIYYVSRISSFLSISDHSAPLSGLLTRRQNAWSQDGGNMRVITNKVNRWPVSRSAWARFVLFSYTALCRVFWFFKTKYNYTSCITEQVYTEIYLFYSCNFFIHLYSYYQYIYWKHWSENRQPG